MSKVLINQYYTNIQWAKVLRKSISYSLNKRANISRLIIMKLSSLIFFLAFVYTFGYTQEKCDTIYSNSEILAVHVKEVTHDAVIYQYPGEAINNTIYKNSIIKIVFSSGRIQVFNEISNFKTVKGGNDWEKVTVTHVESEVKGLFKIGQVTSKAKGTTEFSNMNKVKDRAYMKLKIEAAMRGANMIYLFGEHVKGNDFNTDNSTETNLTGIAYTNIRPHFDDFQELINNNKQFKYVEFQYLGNNSTELARIPNEPKMITIDNIKNESGFIIVQAQIDGIDKNTFTVTYFDDKEIILMYEDTRKIYNLILHNY